MPGLINLEKCLEFSIKKSVDFKRLITLFLHELFLNDMVDEHDSVDGKIYFGRGHPIKQKL